MMEMNHSCDTFLRIRNVSMLNVDDTCVYTKKKEFFCIYSEEKTNDEIHPDSFNCRKLIVEEVFWQCMVEKDSFKELNVSKIGIYKFIGYKPGSVSLKRDSIEGKAAKNILKDSNDVFFCMVPRLLCRSN